MADELLILQEKPAAEYLIAGWRRQWAAAAVDSVSLQ